MKKRKKWTEAEEETLISTYSDLISSRISISHLPTREKKFQPIADRINSLHHLLDPTSYPFQWTWRDISTKIHNMRHQYLGVKQKLHPSFSNPPDWDHALQLWPNFLRYKTVFGDIESHSHSHPSSPSPSSSDEGKVGSLGKMAAELEETRREREEGWRWRWRRRRRESWSRWEEEEMEWWEKMIGMEMEHQKRVVQMHCQAQMQMLGILVRLVCQFLGPASSGAGGGDGGIHGLQQQQQSAGSDDVKNDVKNVVNSGEDYL